MIMIELFIFIIAILFLAIASYSDCLKKEVPDWLNYSLIAFAFFIRIIWSINTNDWHFIAYGILGFIVFLFIGCGMYYLGQWGGGDAKLLMALGIILGIEFNLKNQGIIFLLNFLIVSFFYSIVFLFSYFIINSNKVVKNFFGLLVKEKKYYHLLFIIMFLFAIIDILMPLKFSIKMIFFLIFTSPILYYLSIFIKSVELCCMQRFVDPKELTEGDWIVNDIIVDKKKIYSVKDLGVSKKQIKYLIKLKQQRKINKILIKVGIPFVPCFFLTLIVNLYFGNLLIKLFEILLR